MALALPDIQRFSEFFSEPVLIVNQEGNIVSVNKSVQNEFGSKLDGINRFSELFEVPPQFFEEFSEEHKYTCQLDQKEYILTLMHFPEESFYVVKCTTTYNTYFTTSFFYDHSLEGVIIFDDNWKIHDVNAAACEIYQIKREEFLKDGLSLIFPEVTPEEAQPIWQTMIREGVLKNLYKYRRGMEEIYIDFLAIPHYYKKFHIAFFNNVTEQHVANRALRISEQNLTALFNSSRQSIILIDADYRILMMNETTLKQSMAVLGKAPFAGVYMLNYLPAEYREAVVSMLDIVRTGESLYFERPVPTAQGGICWHEFSLVPIFDRKGKVSRICITCSDINSRKLAEIQLSESEQRFRSLSENSPDLIYIIDLIEHRIIYFNRSIILGYPSDNFVHSESWEKILHPDDVTNVKKHWSFFLSDNNNHSYSAEYRLKNAQGEYEWVNNRHRIIERDTLGKPSKVLLNLTITTKQKQYESALKRNELRLKSLIDNTSDMIWSVDRQLKLTSFNSSFRNYFILNYFKDIEYGDNLLSLLNKETALEWKALHELALKGTRFSSELIDTIGNRDCYYEVSFNPVFESAGKVNGVSVYARDITNRKRVENEIIRTNFELDSFVYRASHDLRAPLRSVLGLVNLIKTDDNPLHYMRYLSLIEKSVDKLDTFIQDLTDFSRNSRLDLRIEEIDFSSVLKDASDNLRYMEHAEKVQMIQSIMTRNSFYSDKSRIMIILQNLISNAIKYHNRLEEKPMVYIKVQTTDDGNSINLIVEDNGVGIHPQYIDKVFDMFFRASESSYGSGLGLYITRQVVEKLGGSIEVSSRPGSGTKFLVRLPSLKYSHKPS